jgi:hypothetical protein
VLVLHTPLMQLVQMLLMHCSVLGYWPIGGGPPVVLHTPFLQVVQKLLTHWVDVDVIDDVDVGSCGIGGIIGGIDIGGGIVVTPPQLG